MKDFFLAEPPKRFVRYNQKQSPSELFVSQGNKTIYTTYLDSRPPQFEKDAVQMLIDILEEQNSLDFKPGFRVHIAHLSDAGSLEKIKVGHVRYLLITNSPCWAMTQRFFGVTIYQVYRM